jgi:hypothetical protein
MGVVSSGMMMTNSIRTSPAAVPTTVPRLDDLLGRRRNGAVFLIASLEAPGTRELEP